MLTAWSVRSGKLISQFLADRLGIPQPSATWLPFAVQAQIEDAGGSSLGAARNNPLNLTTGNGKITWPGQTGTYGGGNAQEMHGDFAAFGSLEDGCRACADNYFYYPGVVAAFKTGDPIKLAQAVQDSPWDSGHYGGGFVAQVQANLGTIVPEGGVTMEEIYKNIFITLNQRWPTDDEVKSFVASGDSPYHYAQTNYIQDPGSGFADGWGFVRKEDAQKMIDAAVATATANVPAEIEKAVLAATEPLTAQIAALMNQKPVLLASLSTGQLLAEVFDRLVAKLKGGG